MPHVELPQAEFKVVLLGDTNTGKTSLVLRFVEGYYRETGRSPTIGAFFLTKRVTVPDQTTCKLLLWDTAGQLPFARLSKTYYQQAAAAILTFDVSQPQSLARLTSILQEVEQTMDQMGRRIVLAIVACKTDLDPTLHAPGLVDAAKSLADTHGAIFVATSAKNNWQVQSLFEQVAGKVWQWHKEATSGHGLPLPIVVGGTVSQKAQRSRSPDTSTVRAARRMSSSQKQPFPNHEPERAINSHPDDVVEQPQQQPPPQQQQQAVQSNVICEGALMGCVHEDPSKGCCIC